MLRPLETQHLAPTQACTKDSRVHRNGGACACASRNSHLVTIIAEDVFPMPGGPDSKTAFLLMSFLPPCAFDFSGAWPFKLTCSLCQVPV